MSALKRLKRPEIFLLFLIGIIPLSWLRPGYTIAKGDEFPSWLNANKTLDADTYLWSTHDMGNVNIMSSFVLYELIWLSLMQLGLSIGLIQILFQVFFFMGAGFSMYYLSRIVYSKLKLSPLASSIFYMFNFFVLQSRLNVGMAWTYVFLPLLMALLIKVLEANEHEKKETVNRNIIYFALTSAIALSFASINPANVIIILFALTIILLFYVIVQRNKIRPLVASISKLAMISVLINLWWTIPIFNYYLWSPSGLNPDVSVIAWSWTHARASFLNLFWLNGYWGWLPEYVPYYSYYSNSVLIILNFIPFLLAASALLFKTNKSRFNIYIMSVVLVLLFLAKGLHEPLGELNLILYTYIPGMVMFREPASKFTMALIPFLSLLIGFAIHSIANVRIGRYKPTKFSRILIVATFSIIFITGTYPLLINPIETKTAQIPFSSYVKIPDYWYRAAEWLNEQPGNARVLMTPPDDFYMMPYSWGYYGTDGFVTRFVQKPTLSYYFGYKLDTNTSAAMGQLYNSITYNRTTEFRGFLDLLNVRFILQRNDIQLNFTGGNMMSPDEMFTFLSQQPYIHLVKRFGQLDIYEYTSVKSYMYTLNPYTLNEIAIRIGNITTVDRSWNFTSSEDVHEWQSATPSNQWQATFTVTQENGTLKAELWNSTWGWKTLNSPLLPARYGDIYQIQINIKGQNVSQVHIKIAEYDANKDILQENYVQDIGTGTFNWTDKSFNNILENRNTAYMQIQVWSGHLTNETLPNTMWVESVKMHAYRTTLNTTGLNLIFQNSTQNRSAVILSYTRINPTRITATVNATQPFILVVSEALDQSWTAYVNGKQIKPTSLYLGLAGFYINQTGQLEITIEYQPQEWFYYASAISVTTLLVCLAYLTYTRTRNKTILKRLRTSFERR